MDDEALGCGGTIRKYQKAGYKICVIFVAHRIYNHCYDEEKNNIQKAHALEAKKLLGYDEVCFLNLPDERLDISVQDIIIPLERHINEIQPEIVYIPFVGDNNQDHRAVFHASRVAIRPAATPFIKRVCMYEVPSSTEQSPPLFESVFSPNYYIDITEYIEEKVAAFRCYKDEKRDYPHPRSEEAIKVLAQKRGVEIGFQYAEAFMVVREKWI